MRERKEQRVIEKYENFLVQEEKSRNTIYRYVSDAKQFLQYINNHKITKEMTMKYKGHLMRLYQISSVNSIIASLNHFLSFLGMEQYQVKGVRTQQKIFCTEERELKKEEYLSLIKEAEREKLFRIAMIIRTIGCTGIRIGELEYLTVEALEKGEIRILCKGKYRVVLMPKRLRKKLLNYVKENKIRKGSIFVTRNGKPVDRSNIWREMQKIAKRARISLAKVFPHNLRHLFARAYYKQEKDIVKLADMLGHANIGTTRIYVISSGAEHRKQLDAMDLVG